MSPQSLLLGFCGSSCFLLIIKDEHSNEAAIEEAYEDKESVYSLFNVSAETLRALLHYISDQVILWEGWWKGMAL